VKTIDPGTTDNRRSRSAPIKLIVEGWRLLPHSYAIVNQWQLLALLRRQIHVKVVDVPYYRRWTPQTGLFDPPAERALRSLEIAGPGETADALLRIFAPFSFTPSTSRVTVVFATLEQQLIRKHHLADFAEYEKLRQAPPAAHVRVLTPSRWSAEGFYRAGFDSRQVIIVPHGADCATFRPIPDARNQARNRLGIKEDAFVFLSVGAMTGNKGIDLLLRGIVEICRKYPQARLLLKGMDPLYGSRDLLARYMGSFFSARDQQKIAEKMIYAGASLSHHEMAMLYQAADVYVSPYRAEGFNLPVLEAAACGLPVICTRGGPTDEFVTDEFARRIESRKTILTIEGQPASRLDPEVDHLIALMSSAIEDVHWRRQAAEAGPRHVAKSYTWDHAVDALLDRLLD
jgi:glycosyltransferase involved in cell wall biosynthesis